MKAREEGRGVTRTLRQCLRATKQALQNIYGRLLSGLRGFSDESLASAENGTSISAYGAQVALSGRFLGGANL
jgi:hypothetical protein